MKNRNTYIEFCDFYIGTTNNGTEFKISKCDFNIVKKYCWRKNNNGYLVTNIPHKDKRYSVEMHRFIINNYPFDPDTKDYVIDHIDRDKLNNTRDNFRFIKRQENSFNSNLPISNSSGVIGVYWHKKNSKWCAKIKKDFKDIYLGSYVDKNDAIKARLLAEIEYFGHEFAPQRDLFPVFVQLREIDKEVSYN